MFKLRQLLIEIFKTFSAFKSINYFLFLLLSGFGRSLIYGMRGSKGGGGLNPPGKFNLFNSHIKFTENRPRIPLACTIIPRIPPSDSRMYGMHDQDVVFFHSRIKDQDLPSAG